MSDTPLIRPASFSPASYREATPRWRLVVSMNRRIALARLILWTFVVGVAGASVYSGWVLRDALWTATYPVRFIGDVNNGYNRGGRVVADARNLAGPGLASDQPVPWPAFFRAWVNVYDQTVEDRPAGNYELDYPPLRLLVMSLWVKQVRETVPNADRWRDEFTAPLLRLNSVVEVLGATGMFVLVRHWSARRSEARSVGVKPALAGLVASELFWFNPAVLYDAHAWPQWDVWLLPFYVWALYCVSTRRWFLAGALVGLGAMFKGQMLLVAPVLPLFALVSGRPVGALKLILGFASAWALVTLPWLVIGSEARAIVAGSTLLATVAACVGFWYGRRRWVGRNAFHLVPIAFVASVSLVALYLNGSFSWLSVGFAYGTRHYMRLMNGPTSNLPALLQTRFQWNVNDVVTSFTLPWGTEPYVLTLRTLLLSVYAFSLAPCAIGAAIQYRRDDPRAMLALVTPWVTMFTLVPQMHERYLLWGAALTAVAAGVSVGWTLIHLVVTLLATISIVDCAFGRNQGFMPDLYFFVRHTNPDIGWMLLLSAALLVYAALAPGRNGRAPRPASSVN